MDCGRLVSLLLSHGGFLHDYLPGGTIGPFGISPNKIYHITVPIMPTAGYEISNHASFKIGNRKYMLESPYLVPKATYIDPELMTGLPRELLAVILFDCFATALMAYVSRYANPTSDEFALSALNSYITHSKRLLNEPNKIKYIKHEAAASLNAFLAANYSSLGAVHAIAEVLEARFGMRFGSALAYVCAEVCAFCYDANPKRYNKIAKMLGAQGKGASEVKKAINNLIKDMKICMPSLKGKIRDAEYEKLAFDAVNHHAMSGCAKQMTINDVADILRKLG